MTRSRKQQRKRCPSMNQLIWGQTCRSQFAHQSQIFSFSIKHNFQQVMDHQTRSQHTRRPSSMTDNFDSQLGFNWHPAANQNADFSHQHSPTSSDAHTSAGTSQTAYCCYKRDDSGRTKQRNNIFIVPAQQPNHIPLQIKPTASSQLMTKCNVLMSLVQLFSLI